MQLAPPRLQVYDRNDPDSWSGKKLVLRGAMHTGGSVVCMQRMRMTVPGDTANRQVRGKCQRSRAVHPFRRQGIEAWAGAPTCP